MSGDEFEDVDRETGEVAVLSVGDSRLSWEPMNEDQARKITGDIKAYAVRLCHLVRDAKVGIAWTPLGYETWEAYVETEFGMSRQRAQQLIDHANKLDLMAEVVELAAPPAEAVTERATRGLKADDLRSALIDAMEESPAELTEAERLEVANKAIATLRKAKAAASTAVVAAAPKTSGAEAPASSASDAQQQDPPPAAGHPSPGNDSPAVDPATGKPDEPHAVEAPGSAEGGTSDAEGASGGEPTSTAPPALPDDWRARLACSVHLLGCPADALRAVLTDDDRIDLTDLHTYLTDLLELI